jgi:anti-anti-sigma factor
MAGHHASPGEDHAGAAANRTSGSRSKRVRRVAGVDAGCDVGELAPVEGGQRGQLRWDPGPRSWTRPPNWTSPPPTTWPTRAAQPSAATPGCWLLDLTGLSFCDARGLGALVRIANNADAAGCRYALIAPQPPVVKLLRIGGLSSRLPVFASIRDALAHLPP